MMKFLPTQPLPVNDKSFLTKYGVARFSSLYTRGYKVFALVFSLLLFDSLAGFAQVEEWVKRWPGMGNGNVSALALDGQGNVYATGGSPGVIKYDASGAQQWAVKHNANAFRVGGLAADAEGNVYLAQTSYNDNASYPDEHYIIRKLNSSGQQQWQATYDHEEENDIVKDIAVDEDGNVYVTGISLEYSIAGSSFHFNYATVKYNSLGEEQWVARYDGPATLDDYATDLEVDAEGNVYVTGYSEGEGIAYATIKYNALGEEQWVARYEGPDNLFNYARQLALDADGNVYVTGSSEAIGSGADYATIKYNASGTQQWVARYNGPDNLDDEAFSIQVDAMGNVYVSGNSTYASGIACSNPSAWTIVKYTAAGAEEWTATYEGTGTPAMDTDTGGNVYVAGGVYNGDCDQTDYTTVKWSTSGAQQWEISYDGPTSGNDYATSIAVDSTGNVHVTGSSAGNGTTDLATIKYSQEAGTEIIAVDDAYTTDEGTVLNVEAPGVLSNDMAAPGSTLTAALVTEPNNGMLVLDPDGGFTYAPDGSFVGTDSFTYKVLDGTSESNTATVSITVDPMGGGDLYIHNISAPRLPQKINTTINAIALYSGSNVNSATWEWGDGSSSAGTVGDSIVTGSHSYVSAGLYTISLTIKDAYGDSTRREHRHVVVYDPKNDFVAGTGWFHSPAGAYTGNPTGQGKVDFDFAIQTKNSGVVQGVLNFKSNSGNIKFVGNSFTSMAVTGNTAMVEGTGSLNGNADYNFMLSADDHQDTPEGVDHIRLQVWDSNETLVYDNQMGDPIDAVATSPVKNGAILVHGAIETLALQRENFKAYPVPLSGNSLWLKFPAEARKGVYNVAINDMTGRKMAEKQFVSKEEVTQQWELDHNSWPPGLYILTITGEGMMEQLKIKK